MIDDVVVGGGSTKAGAMTDEFAQSSSKESDNTGPLEERLQSKNWSTRAQAFDELNQLFKGAKSAQDQVFKDHCSMWKKYLGEQNPGALEKCLEALYAFVDMGEPKVVVISQNDVIKALIEKCIGHTKPTIKQKGLECFNLLFEVTESFEDSVETMIECLNAKNIKVSQAAQLTLNSWLGSFGAKKVKLQPFMKLVLANANSSNPQIRQEAMNFYKECYKWLGEGIKPLIQDLKKQQLDDLDKGFEEVKDKPKTVRYTRTEKKKMKDSALDDIIQKEEDQKGADTMAYDLADSIDLITKYNDDWQDKILEMKKWTEKKEQLEKFISESNVPKIKNGDFTNLVKTLKKLIGDSNQVVSQLAIKACGNLAKGLRTDFGEANCKELMGTLIQKFKEKKTQMIEEVHVVLDAFTNCTDLEVMTYDLTSAINDKAPTVKKNICLYLDRVTQATYIDVLQRCSNDLVGALMKNSDDQAGDVRDAALFTLGILKGRLGESIMSKFLQDLNPQKLSKVNEASNCVQPSKYDRPEKKEIKKGPAPAANKGIAKKGPINKQEEEKKKAPKKDEEKITAKSQQQKAIDNNFNEEQPLGGGNTKINFEDMPIGGGGNIDENDFNEKPLGGGKKGTYELPDDFEMMDPFGGANTSAKPVQKPPVRPNQQKAKPKKDLEEEKGGWNDDVQMEDEGVMSPKEVKKPLLKAKVEKKEAPKTTSATIKAAPKGTGVGAGGDKEEDLGAGLSKEESEAKVQETFSAESVTLMEGAKWQEKVEGFKSIGEQIIELQPTQDVIEALAKFVKGKMKDWKESNVNLVKETIALFTIVSQNCEKVNKRTVSCLMHFLSDKIGDVKTMQSVHELLLALSDLVTSKFIAMQIIKHASNAKNPKVLQESCTILTTLIDEFGIMQMPLKEMIAYGTIGINHSNPQVRIAAMALFAMMYKHGGEMVKNFLKDVKESTMKLLNEEFEKVTPLKKGEFRSKRDLKGEAAEEMQIQGGGAGKKGAGGGGIDDLLPREDISKYITPKLVAEFKNADWKARKASAEKVEEFLRTANMRIQPVGLNELMDNMKLRMVDPHKGVQRSYIQLITLLVEALGPQSKLFAKKLMPSILNCLADKNTLVRVDIVVCMDKWAEHIGPELVINHLAPLLIQENPELRHEGLTWIIKNTESIRIADSKELIKPLVSCLSDKVPNIRNMTEQIAGEVMLGSGYQAFSQATKDLKPAVQNMIKPILEKVKNKVGANNTGTDPNNGSLGIQKPPTSMNSSTALTQLLNEPKADPNNSSLRGQQQNKGRPQTALASGNNTNTNKNDIGSETLSKNTFGEALKQKQKQQTPVGSKRSESKEPARLGRGGLGDSIKSFQDQNIQPNQEQLSIVMGLKDRRAENDRKSKWQTEDVKSDFIDKLKNYTNQVLGTVVCGKMFSNDFKQHNEVIEMFAQLVQSQQQQDQQITEILDIIFKWSQVKLGDSSNTQFAVKVFDFYAILFRSLEEAQYCFQDFEAMVLIPLLCDKAGHNNAILKEKVKRLIPMLYKIYDVQKCYNMLIQYGLNSKNMRAQAECLDELDEFIKTFGIDYTTEKDLRLVAKLADSNDKGIRENSLKVLGEVYKHLDNDIFKIIGEVTPKVQGLLEQRFKKVKAAPTMGLAQSNSSSNLQLESGNIGQQDKQSPKAGGSKTTTSSGAIGLQRTKTGSAGMIDNQKKSITPRNPAYSSKEKPPSFGGAVQSQMNRSINNQFNQSNKSNEDNKKSQLQNSLPSQSSSNHQQPQAPLIQGKGILKKIQSQDNANEIGGIGSKRLIPSTQRMDSSNSEFNMINNRKSGGQDQQPQSQQNTFQSQLFQPKQMGGGGNKHGGFIDDGDDDADDLRSLINEAFQTDPEQDKLIEEITKHIYQLKHGDLSKRVDSLVSLNEMISQIEVNKLALVRTSNELINAFTHVLMDIFERPVEEIPLRFAKYFITIVLKACSCKEIMREANEESIFDFAEQLLTRLLIEGLDKVGENKEGELILKNLNSSMLRLLENCNHTYIFCVLFNLLRKYKDFHRMPKLPGLIIKCLLKLSKILEKLIEKLNMDKILLAIHEYLVVIDHDNKTQNDEMGIRIVKTVTNELVKLKRDSIWEAYRVIQCHGQQDNHIYRWIQIILKSLQSQGGNSGQTSGGSLDQEVRLIIEELRNSEMFEAAIPKLHGFLESNPQTDLNDYLQDCSKTFQDFIKKNLEKHRQQLKDEENKNNDDNMMNSLKSTNHSDNSRGAQNQDQDPKQGSMSTSNRVTEYQSKLSTIKQRFNQKNGENTNDQQQQISQQEPQQQKQVQQPAIYQKSQILSSQQQQQQNKAQAQQPNLNSSFSDMNNRLTQKWSQINKKPNLPKDAPAHMSSTMGGFGGPSGLEKVGNVNMNQSSGGTQQSEAGQQNIKGASNSDLNQRLAEMKARLQALKKTDK